MTEREILLHYINKLSDERIHKLMGKAQWEYASQKSTEEVSLTEKSLCASIIANVEDRRAHIAYVFAKSLCDEQGANPVMGDRLISCAKTKQGKAYAARIQHMIARTPDEHILRRIHSFVSLWYAKASSPDQEAEPNVECKTKRPSRSATKGNC